MRFRYLFDPLFVACLAIYALNRFAMKPYFSFAFLHDHLNDLICIPFWVPIMLRTQKLIGLRAIDRAPNAAEIVIPLIIWSWAFEVWLPRNAYFSKWCTSDPQDILFYALGALGASIFWNAWYRHGSENPTAVSSLE
jgi:hypothetical protein